MYKNEIFLLSNRLTLIVLDEGHFRNVSCALKTISTFVLLFYNLKIIFIYLYVLFTTK